MPEGDAVRRTARRLDEVMRGERLVTAQIRVPAFATADLVGYEVVETATVGKHLLTRLRAGERHVTLHSHLRMDGRWATGRAAARPVTGPAHQIRVWLVGGRGQAVGLRLMEVRLVPTEREDELIGHLGPDILAVAGSVAADSVRSQGGRPLADALLDQRVVCGLGTMWVAELAFDAGVHPLTPVESATRLDEALARTRRRMLAAVGDGRRSRTRLNVFERKGRPCLRCGDIIRTGRVGTPPRDRITYWCPTCQPGR